MQPDPRFVRRGVELWHSEPVGVADAVLGAGLRVPSSGRPVEAKVPPGTQRGKGLPPFGGGYRGDLYVVVDVRVLTRIDTKEQRLCENLR